MGFLTSTSTTCNGTSPSSTVNYLYDGSGQRVAMQSTVNGTVTTTAYIGNLEEVQTSGNTTQTTTYYSLGGKRIAAKVNSVLYYFGYDALGSQVAVLNTSGSIIGSQLYSPYGSSRYSNGTLPTSNGFTGQRADSVTGLDYYNARYYDPVVGRFMAADTVQGNGQGMDPYGYVGGNPETRTDPTGKRFVFGGPGETYNPSACGSNCTIGAGGTVVSTYVPPPYDVQIRNNPPMTKPTTKPTPSGNGGCGGCDIVTSTHTNNGGNSESSQPKQPTPDQISNAKSVAGSAVAAFTALAAAALGVSQILKAIAVQFFAWGTSLLLESAALGPFGLITGALGLGLIALGAAAVVLAAQAQKLAAMFTALVIAFGVEYAMPDSWWTPNNVAAFGATAGSIATAVGVWMDFKSFFTKLPGMSSKALVAQTGALMTGRGLGATLGFLSGEATAREITHYTRKEADCLTYSSCVTN